LVERVVRLEVLFEDGGLVHGEPELLALRPSTEITVEGAAKISMPTTL